MAIERTPILHAGRFINEMLSGKLPYGARVVAVRGRELTLPYVVYQRTSLDMTAVKSGDDAASATVEVTCYTSSYDHSVALADAVVALMNGVRGNYDGMYLRSCRLVDGDEPYVADAYAQRLVFKISIN